MTGSDFAVVVITRNRYGILEQCLQSLDAQTVPPGEIVVIDSSDKFTPIAARAHIQHWHFPAGRQQMPRARNEGIRRSSAPIVAFVDDDCLVATDWLEQLREAYRAHPEFSGVGGKILDARWHYDPARPVGRVDEKGRVTSNFFGDPGGIVEVQILPGGNMSFRRSALLGVGGFDPNYIATNHREDPDLCLRLTKTGARLGYQPRAEAVHLNARNSLGELTRWHEFYLRYSFGRNEAYFLARHFPRSIVQRWPQDTLQQILRAGRAGSLMDGLCSAVHGLSFGLGLLSYAIWGKSEAGQGLRNGTCLF